MVELNYVKIARRDIGLREVKGASHAVRIVEMLSRLGAWWRDDETPWCGVALGAWMKEAGLPYPKAYYRALAWLDYGVACDIQYGAIAVLTRKGGGHVGIVTGMSSDGKHIRLLGGNQGDTVSEMWFPKERITAYRMPVGIVKSIAVPLAKVGDLSVTEA
jgi:uncharacterized protein (TIGR02594 family)